MRSTRNRAENRAAPGALCALMVLGGCLQPADEIIDRSGSKSLVFVKERSIGRTLSPMSANTNEFYAGSDLYLLSPISPSGGLTNLTEKWTRASANEANWGAAADPEVSFDGKRILFSMRESRTGNANRRWQIYELDLESGALSVLTAPAAGDDMDPAYVDDNHVVFGSTRNQILDEYERRAVPQLFLGERGAPGEPLRNVRQITFNQSHDQNPFVHSGGQVFFSRWDHLGDPNKIPLFGLNPDGTGQFVKYGADETFSGTDLSSGQRVFMEARELADGGIVTSMMERNSEFEGGAIGIIDLSQFTAPPQMITPATSPYNTDRRASRAIFKTPYPIMDGAKERILVAQSAREVGGDIRNASVNYDLFVMDKDGGNMRAIHTDPDYNDYDPVVVQPRALPFKAYAPKPEVAEALAGGGKTGTFFTADIYSRMQGDGHFRPDPNHLNADSTKGQGKYYRFLEAVSIPANGTMRGGDLGDTEFEKQRVIGYGDIRADGSFSAEVPANTPLHLQVLDENAMMLVNQLQWINVMPGERRVCTGCHGPRERDTDIEGFTVNPDLTVTFSLDVVRNYLSGFNNAQKVAEHPAARTDTVDFMDLADPAKAGTVQHIFDLRCNSCHGVATAGAQGGGVVLQYVKNDSLEDDEKVSSVYAMLTRDNGYRRPSGSNNNGGLAYVNSRGGARNSPLAWVLYGRHLGTSADSLFRPVSHDHSAMWKKDARGRIEPFAAENRDLLTLIEWMDMGIQFSNSTGKKAP
jgi:hypothetical protein